MKKELCDMKLKNKVKYVVLVVFHFNWWSPYAVYKHYHKWKSNWFEADISKIYIFANLFEINCIVISIDQYLSGTSLWQSCCIIE